MPEPGNQSGRWLIWIAENIIAPVMETAGEWWRKIRGQQ